MLPKLRSPYLLDRVYLDPAYRSIRQGLVHHCQFFEMGSTKLRDLSKWPIVSNAPVFGTLSASGAVWVPGRNGYVLKFTAASSGKVDWSNIGDLNFGSGGFTVSCWVNPTTTTGSGGSFPNFVGKNQAGNGTAANGWHLFINTGTNLNGHTVSIGAPSLYGTDGSTIWQVSSAHLINDGNWHLVAAGRDPGANVFWIAVDGKLRETASAGTIGSITNSGDLQYAFRPDGSLNPNFYQGQLDDVRIWNRSLTEGEVQWLYKQKLPSRIPQMAFRAAGAAPPAGGGGTKQTAVTIN